MTFKRNVHRIVIDFASRKIGWTCQRCNKKWPSTESRNDLARLECPVDSTTVKAKAR